MQRSGQGRASQEVDRRIDRCRWEAVYNAVQEARGAGLTFGPRVLLWIGAVLAVPVGVLGLSTHVRSDD